MSRENIAVSVIMPVFNAEKYIKESIESVLSQTFTDFEFIIIDDGSSDNSVQIIREFTDSRIRLIYNDENSGIVLSLNKGLALAKGEFIARIDADDICLRNRFETQFNFLRNNKQVGLCSGHVIKVNDKGEIIGKLKVPITNQECKMSFIFKNPIIHPATMFRKSLAQRVGGYKPGTEPAEDYDLWLRLSNISEIENLNRVLIYYRIHENNYSRVKMGLYVEKFKYVFKNDNNLSKLLELDFMPLHLRTLMGTWSEKTSFGELRKFLRWKNSLLMANNKLNYFQNKNFKKVINYELTSILITILKTRNNTINLKMISFCYLFLFSPINVIKVIVAKLTSMCPK